MPLAAMFIEYLQSDPVFYVSVVFGMTLSIVLHELGHGVAAIWQGDDTPRLLGHMTWDPMVHMGPMALGALAVMGISWGMMPVNPSRFRSKYGDAMVSLAGPLTNVLIALVALSILTAWYHFGGQYEAGAGANAQRFLWILGYANFALAIFNMLPITPLDGSTVLGNIWPAFGRFARNPNNQPVFFGAFILVFIAGAPLLFDTGARAADAYINLFLAP